jgi:hypothetical protein
VNEAVLVIAIVGVVLGTLSLVWQAISFLLSGPRVRASIAEGFRGLHSGIMIGHPSIYTEEGRATLEARRGTTRGSSP